MAIRSKIALTLALPVAACGGSGGPIDGDQAMAHVQALVEIGPRPFGSENLAKATDYIEGQLQSIGVEPVRHEVMQAQEKKLIRKVDFVILPLIYSIATRSLPFKFIGKVRLALKFLIFKIRNIL